MLSIGEFSKLCRVSTKTLRYYDAIGLLKPDSTSGQTGYRYYSAAQLGDMLLISRLKRYGFSLPEIAAALAVKDPADLAQRIRQKQNELQQRLQEQAAVLRHMGEDAARMERSMNLMAELDIKVIETKPIHIYSIRRNMSLSDFSAAMQELFAGLYGKGLKPSGAPLAVYHSPDFNPEHTDIEVAVPVEGGGTRTLGGGTACMAVHYGSYDRFDETYTILTQWMEANGYRCSGAPYEIYVKSMEASQNPEDWVTEIYFPAEKLA